MTEMYIYNLIVLSALFKDAMRLLSLRCYISIFLVFFPIVCILVNFQLSPVMLDYVRESSDLLATLLTLVYTDWSEESSASFEENVMSDDMEMRSRSSSDVSIVDIRSYCYRRLVDDFPVLQRHMLVYAIPLAAADNMEISFEIEPLLKFVTNNADQDIKVCLFNLHIDQQSVCN